MLATRIRLPLVIYILLLVVMLAFFKVNILIFPLLFCLLVFFILTIVEKKSFSELLVLNQPAIKAKKKWLIGISPHNFLTGFGLTISAIVLFSYFLKPFLDENSILRFVVTGPATIFLAIAFEKMDSHKNFIFLGNKGILIPYRHYQIVEWNQVESLNDSNKKDQVELVFSNGETIAISTKKNKDEVLDDEIDNFKVLEFLEKKINNDTTVFKPQPRQ